MANNFTIEIEGLSKLRKSFKKSPQIVRAGLSRAIKTSVNIIRPIMQRNAPFASGKLRKNIQSVASGLEGRVGPNLRVTPYALFVEKGTKPHEIRPRTKQALFWPGARHPVKRVMHPGTKANPFVEKTVKEIETPVQRIFGNQIDKILKIIAK